MHTLTHRHKDATDHPITCISYRRCECGIINTHLTASFHTHAFTSKHRYIWGIGCGPENSEILEMILNTFWIHESIPAVEE